MMGEQVSGTVAVHAPEPWWTVTQAAAYAQCGEKLVYRAVRRREIRHVKLNSRGDLRFKASWVDAWLESKSQPVDIL